MMGGTSVPLFSEIPARKRAVIMRHLGELDSTRIIVDGNPEFVIPIYHYDTPYLSRLIDYAEREDTRNEPADSPVFDWFARLKKYVESKTIVRGENRYILDRDWQKLYQ